MIYNASSKEEVLCLAKEYDAISFDIFDTLIMREVYSPEDVFEILEHKVARMYGISKFAEYRERAILENDIPNPNIYQVYEKLKELSGISDEIIKYALDMELDIEKRVLLCRQEMVDIFNIFIEEGKKVILITDMYLTRDIIDAILSGLGISGYADLMVSCEYRSLKCERLFALYKDKHNANRYLHIGDNYQSDNVCAEKEGIDSIHIRSAKNKYLDSIFNQYEKFLISLSQRNLIGHFNSVVFNNPFRNANVLLFEEVAYVLVCPIVLFVFLNVIRIAKMKSINTILLSARDGYLISKLFLDEELKGYSEGIKAEYFYTSRKAVTEAAAVNRDNILWLSGLPYKGNMKATMHDVLGLALDDYDEQMDSMDYISNHLEEIILIAEDKKRNYDAYIDTLNLNGKALFFDLISTGTCQLFLKDYFRMDLLGVYLVKQSTDEKRREELESISLFSDKESSDTIEKFHHFLEKVMTSDEPSLRGFNNEGMPIFCQEHRLEKDVDNIRLLQKRIVDNVRMLLFCETSIDDSYADTIEEIAKGILDVGYSNDMILYDDWMEG